MKIQIDENLKNTIIEIYKTQENVTEFINNALKAYLIEELDFELSLKDK